MTVSEILRKTAGLAITGTAVGVLGILIACGSEPKPRVYGEVAFKELVRPGTGMGGMGTLPPANASPVDLQVTWTLPENWMIRDSANAMRVGSFAVPDSQFLDMGEADPRALDVSVVQLAGDAGGLEANIRRWMGQVGLIASAAELKALIDSADKLKATTGQDGIYVDFTEKLSSDMTQDKSIFGAIVSTSEYTVFVKAMGERGRLLKAKGQIKTFCESLAIRKPGV